MNPPPLTISLFGPLRILVHGAPLPHVRTRSVEWLLALLALRHGRTAPRAWLAGTLWPESRESQALQNLRNNLMWLRQALGPEAGRIQSPSRDTLTLDLEGAEVDVAGFDAAIRAGDESSLQSAVALYTGPLLEGCYEEWATPEREAREDQCLAALETLAEWAGERGSHAEAIQYLQRAEMLDPLRDSVARRLMASLAASGDAAAAVEVYRELRNRLHADMATAPDAETTRLFQQIRADARQAAKPKEDSGSIQVRQSARPKEENGSSHPALSERKEEGGHGLRSFAPVHPLATLIGREEALEEVQERLRESRLVTLVGAGGVGKTRLAMEVAARMEAEFEAGAAWVELAPLTDGASVLPAIGAALGIQEEKETEGKALAAQILARLPAGGFLLALDNCEHLLDSAAAAVERLLQGRRELRVLATSRQRLGLTGELVWHVPSLSAPEPDALPTDEAGAVEHALTYPAVQLFVERATSARSGFRLAGYETAAAVCTICRRLDGIPLALELAAARVGTLTPAQIAARLDNQFTLLTQGARTALPRQKTLRALIDWSYNLLDENEKTLLCHLAVFPDGWTLEAAEGVSDERSPAGETDVLDLLASLTDKSLVVAEERAGSLRYRMLETIRQYAAERLREGGEEDARQRFLGWMLALAESAQDELLGPRPDTALDRLEAEKGNFREALAWAGTHRSAIYLRLAAALWPFWEMRGHVFRGGCAYLLAAAEGPDLRGSPARAVALLGAASMLTRYAVTPQAVAFAYESLEQFRALDDAVGIASALLLLGHMGLRVLYTDRASSRLFTHAETRVLLTEGLAHCRDLRWMQAGALVLIHLGLLARMEGDIAQGQTLREEGWSLLDRGDDGRTPTYCLNLMNGLAMELYMAAGERTLLERSLVLTRKTGQKPRLIALAITLGRVAESQGDSAFAIACFQEAIQACRETGNAQTLCEALQLLGNSYYRQGDYRSAGPIYAESLELFRKLDPTVERSANNLGSTLFHLGKPEQARKLHREALAAYGSQIEGIAWSLERLGVVEAMHGEPSTAIEILGAAAAARQEFGGPMSPWDQADWDLAVTTLCEALGRPEFERLFAAAHVAGWQQTVDKIRAR